MLSARQISYQSRRRDFVNYLALWLSVFGAFSDTKMLKALLCISVQGIQNINETEKFDTDEGESSKRAKGLGY